MKIQNLSKFQNLDSQNLFNARKARVSKSSKAIACGRKCTLNSVISAFFIAFFISFATPLLTFFFSQSVLLKADSENLARSKIVYLKMTSYPKDEQLYVGQEISVSYEVSLFAGAQFLNAHFDKTNGVEVKSPVRWANAGDSKLNGTAIFKIKSAKFAIPNLFVNVLAADGSYDESASSGALQLEAIDLYSNKNYIGVIGSDFRILRFASSNYDAQNNVVLFEFQVKSQNAADIAFSGVQIQNLNDFSQADGIANGIFSIVIPKDKRELKFEYFDLRNNRFESVSVPVLPSQNTDLQSDLKPRANYAIFKLAALGLAILFFIALFIWRHYKIFLFIAAILAGVLCYVLMFSNSFGTLKKGAMMSILPIENSTIVRVLDADVPVEILDSRVAIIDNQKTLFYKVLIGDSQSGWVRAQYVQKSSKLF